VDDVLVVLEAGRVAFAGQRAAMDVIASGPSGPETLEGTPIPPEPDEEIVVDGFVMPGVVDRHVHIGLSDPAAVVAGGVTAVRDLGWPPEEIWPLADLSESPAFDGPLIRGVGPILTCRDGYPTRSGWAPPGTGLEVLGADEAARAVTDVLGRSGVSVVKVALNADAGATLTDAELLAICDTAHAAEASITVHAQGPGQVERALGAGVDEFAHCPWSERLPDSVVEAMAKRTRIVSTLDIHSFGRQTPELRTALDNLRRFLLAGGSVAYGTDLGNGAIPPGIHPREVLHLFAAGLSPEGILRAVTFRPLEVGEPADLVVLGENPLETVDAYEDVRMVIRGGRPVR
jgi:imidazolonepropionase-like amidohydrolase